MINNPWIVVFGDELGIPLVLTAVPNNVNICLVIDSNRVTNRQFLDIDSKHPMLVHPIFCERNRFVEELKKRKPVLGVIFSYNRILWSELIGIFSNGVVNLHGGKLPEYRGSNVLQWAIINGEKEAGVSLLYVDEGIDTGDIIAHSTVPINNEDTAVTIRDKIKWEGQLLLKDWLSKLIEQKLEGQRQPEINAKYWNRRRPEDGQIDWSFSVKKIYNLIRALVKPWPGAFYHDKFGKKIVIDHLISMEEICQIKKEMDK